MYRRRFIENIDRPGGMMYELALFAGAGGGLLASKWLLGWQTVCYIENAKYPVEVIKARIKDGLLDDAPIWDDVRTFRRDNPDCGEFIKRLAGLDNLVISGGFPCQPFSTAGKQLGQVDERNMWPDTIRIVREIRPRYVFLENVPTLLSSGYFDTILSDLAESGYDCRWDCFPASSVGANHRRDRLWLVAYDNGHKRTLHEPGRQREVQERDDANGGGQTLAHANGKSRNDGEAKDARGENRLWRAQEPPGRCSSITDLPNAQQPGLEGTARQGMGQTTQLTQSDWWQIEPDVGRMVDGVAARVDRLKALGNGQVSLVAAVAWRLLSRD